MKHDRHTIIKWISNALLALGAFIGAITLIGTYRLARELPAGACPYTSQVLSFFRRTPSQKEIVDVTIAYFLLGGCPSKNDKTRAATHRMIAR